MRRREFLHAPLLPLARASPRSASPSRAPLAQSYGTAAGRVRFGDHWRERPEFAFESEVVPDYHRLRTGLDVRYSRCEQPVSGIDARPLRAILKLRCEGGAARTLFTFGVATAAHGCWAFSLGSAADAIFDLGGWRVMRNAADPAARAPIAGYDDRDWHTFEAVIPGRAGPVRIYCDGHHVFDLLEPVTAARRSREREAQRARHGSRVEPVPEVPAGGDGLFLESRHPGQLLCLDRVELHQEPPTVRGPTLPVALDRDWDLDGVRMVENELIRASSEPVLRASDVPALGGVRQGAGHPRVLRDGTGFHMYFMAAPEGVRPVQAALYHAVSPDGLRWRVTPDTPVLRPGAPGEWDAGAIGQCAVLKEGAIFRMWYSGYAEGISQGRAGYAESRDGVVWTRPKLGLHRFGGRDTNIVFPLQAGLETNEYELPHWIVHDPGAAPDRRYVLFFHAQGPRGYIVDVATSPDGLRFVRAPHNARAYAFDRTPRAPTLHEGAVVLHESRHWWWAMVGHHDKGPGMEGYGHRLARWSTGPMDRANPGFGLWRSERVQLAPIPGSWEGKSTHVGTFMEVGEEWWAYYTSSWDGPPVSVGLAKVGRHRLLGLELLPGRPHGWITTPVFPAPREGWQGLGFAINASGGGSIRGELWEAGADRPIAGFTAADCRTVSADGFALPLAWTAGAVPADGRPVRLRLRLERGSGAPQLHAVYLDRAR